MYYSDQRRKTLSKGIFLMWSNWAISVGTLCLLIALAYFIPPKIVPLLAILFDLMLISLSHRRRQQKTPSCFRLGFIVEIVLLISALLLTFFYVYIWVYEGVELTGQPANPEGPQIPVLVIAPVATIVSLYYLIRGNNSTYCMNCMRNQGDNTDPGYLGRIFSKESEYQIRLFFYISLFITIVTWIYYLVYYINVSLNRSDVYFFIFFPLAISVASLLFFAARYFNTWMFYCNNTSTARMLAKGGTTLRYIVICGDKMLLSEPAPGTEVITTDDIRIDVPVKITVPFTENVAQYQADDYFKNATGLSDADVRLLFVSHDPGMYQNVFHYAAFLKNCEADEENLKGQWFNIHEISSLIRTGLISSQLSQEVHRIYTVAMAWKTYDANGRRLHEIKHYRPTFKLKDMHKWDVDYNDPNWIFVSNVNEDKPFFKLRRFWNRLLSNPQK